MRDQNTDRKLRTIQIAGKTLIALASVPIFLYAIESARGLVRILGGIPSFLSLVSIIVLGLIELVWLVVVVDRKLSPRAERTWSTLLRYIGIEAIALFVLGAAPAIILAAAAGVSILVPLAPLEMALLPTAAIAAVVCFVAARR